MRGERQAGSARASPFASKHSLLCSWAFIPHKKTAPAGYTSQIKRGRLTPSTLGSTRRLKNLVAGASAVRSLRRPEKRSNTHSVTVIAYKISASPSPSPSLSPSIPHHLFIPKDCRSRPRSQPPRVIPSHLTRNSTEPSLLSSSSTTTGAPSPLASLSAPSRLAIPPPAAPSPPTAQTLPHPSPASPLLPSAASFRPAMAAAVAAATGVTFRTIILGLFASSDVFRAVAAIEPIPAPPAAVEAIALAAGVAAAGAAAAVGAAAAADSGDVRKPVADASDTAADADGGRTPPVFFCSREGVVGPPLLPAPVDMRSWWALLLSPPRGTTRSKNDRSRLTLGLTLELEFEFGLRLPDVDEPGWVVFALPATAVENKHKARSTVRKNTQTERRFESGGSSTTNEC